MSVHLHLDNLDNPAARVGLEVVMLVMCVCSKGWVCYLETYGWWCGYGQFVRARGLVPQVCGECVEVFVKHS